MEYKIKILSDGDDKIYEKFIYNHKESMIYHSLKYKKLLLYIIKNSSAIYLGAFINNELVGVLPAILKKTDVGCVINSLPFYGSNGGTLTVSKDSDLIKKKLYEEIKRIAIKENALSTVIIESLISIKEFYFDNDSIIFDERYSQITFFKNINYENIEESLMNLFHSKTRNMVRKSMKSNFNISHGSSKKYFDNLVNLHNLNMNKLKGKAKPAEFFKLLKELFIYDKDYRIYSASIDGKYIASLLIFYFKDQVEYFLPAIDENYKNLQPLSGLIYKSMFDSINERNIKLWNWGGTHLDQENLFKFKSKWGSTNKIYKYFILADVPRIKEVSKNTNLFEQFEYFYIYPKKYLN